MFIVINKIVTQYKKDLTGKTVKNPRSNRPVVDGMKIVQETIDLSDVKSSREYHDPKNYHENGIKGDVTVVYMKGKPNHESGKLPEIHINENIQDWNKRIGAIEVNE